MRIIAVLFLLSLTAGCVSPAPVEAPEACDVQPTPGVGYLSLEPDPVRGGVRFFGGATTQGWADQGLDTLYHLHGCEWVAGSGVPLHNTLAMAYSPDDDLYLAFLGFDDVAEAWMSPRAETWTYDADTDTWAHLDVVNPPPRLGTSLVYDAGSKQFVLFGGADAAFTLLADTWTFDLGSQTWTLRSPDRSPPATAFHQMAYEQNTDKTVLFGGYLGPGNIAPGFATGDLQAHGQTWTYDSDADTWERVGGPAPAPRVYHAMAASPKMAGVLLYGGVTQPNERPYGDTWLFSGDSWSRMAPSLRPEPRGWHAMAFDPDRGGVVLHGGGPARDSFMGDTWMFNSKGETWTRVTAAPEPAATTP